MLWYIFYSLNSAGLKHSLNVYTLKKICVVGFLHEELADILWMKTTLGPFFSSNYPSFHFIYKGSACVT